MDATARLEAIEHIRNLKARYLRLIDTKDWQALPDLFTHDHKVLTPDGRIWLCGGEAYASSLRDSLDRADSFHQGLTAEIEIAPDGTAHGIWAMQDRITWHDVHPREGWKAISGRGHYHETYRHEPDRHETGGWRIASLCLVRTALDIEWPQQEQSR